MVSLGNPGRVGKSFALISQVSWIRAASFRILLLVTEASKFSEDWSRLMTSTFFFLEIDLTILIIPKQAKPSKTMPKNSAFLSHKIGILRQIPPHEVRI